MQLKTSNTGQVYFNYWNQITHLTDCLNNLDIVGILLIALLYTYSKQQRRVNALYTALILLSLSNQDLVYMNNPLFTPNKALTNPLVQYHPPTLLIPMGVTLLIVLIKAKNGLNFINLKQTTPNTPTKPVIISLVLASWWANQELFWGSYWNWDPVELSSVLVLLNVALWQHHTLGKLYRPGIALMKTRLHTTIALTVLLLNRSEFANSIHRFNNLFLLNVDTILIRILLLTILTVTTYNIVLVQKGQKRSLPQIHYVLLVIEVVYIYIIIQNRDLWNVKTGPVHEVLLIIPVILYYTASLTKPHQMIGTAKATKVSLTHGLVFISVLLLSLSICPSNKIIFIDNALTNINTINTSGARVSIQTQTNKDIYLKSINSKKTSTQNTHYVGALPSRNGIGGVMQYSKNNNKTVYRTIRTTIL